ncbi:hypothetical protein Tco_0355110 [Tanacetum coccineum]
MFDRAFKRVNTFVNFRTDLVEGSSKRAGTKLEQEVTKKQKVDDVQETAEVDNGQEVAKIKELMKIVSDEEEVAIDAIPLAVKPPSIVDWEIHIEGKKSYYQIIKADKKPEEGYKRVLWGDLKVMFEPHVEDTVWRNQQDYRVLEWKLYDSFTAALIDVNAAQSKLVLLVNFNENYSKCLRLLEEVTTTRGRNVEYPLLGQKLEKASLLDRRSSRRLLTRLFRLRKDSKLHEIARKAMLKIGIHDTFHVSTMKKCLADGNLHVPLEEIKNDNELRFVEEPIEIMDRKVKKLKQIRIPIVKVRWNSQQGPKFSWECEDEMKRKFQAYKTPFGRSRMIKEHEISHRCSSERVERGWRRTCVILDKKMI